MWHRINKIFVLIRFPNLLITLLTQYLVWYFLIKDDLIKQHLVAQFPEFQFFLLVLSTIFITASGYIINDYYDIKTDLINKPDKVVIGHMISENTALIWYGIINVSGLLLGFYLAYDLLFPELAFIQLITAGLLYFYATLYKRMFLIGNIVVSALSGIAVILPLIYEIKAEINLYTTFFVNWIPIIIYGIFAFLTTLIREITKDIQDIEGDKALKCKTLPIVLGENASKIILIALTLVVVINLTILQLFLFKENQGWGIQGYLLVFIQAPFLCFMYLLYKARNKKHYAFLSTLMKLIMLSGVLSIFLL